MAWARQHHVDDLHLVVEDDAGLVARRASLFADAARRSGCSTGTELHAAQPDARPPAEPSPHAPELAALLVEAGLDVVVEHGIVAGEVLGLEVRPWSSDGVGLEVGVGEADRELPRWCTATCRREAALASRGDSSRTSAGRCAAPIR